jgi:hypothetical protein
MKKWIIETLLRLYPAAWRREYGPELIDVLLARPLTAGTVGDVFWNGLWQRGRLAEPSTLVGLAMLLLTVAGFVWNIAAPPLNGHDKMVLLQNPLAFDVYVLVLVGCGCWTHLRYSGKLFQSGRAAVKVSVMAGIPVMLAGLLMLIGVLGVIVLKPGETPTTFREHGFAYTYYEGKASSCWLRVSEPATLQSEPLRTIQSVTCPPARAGILISPLFRLPESWIWGAVGGALGRWIVRRRRRPLAT